MVASLGIWSPFCSRGMQSGDQHHPWPAPRGPGGGQRSRLRSSHSESLTETCTYPQPRVSPGALADSQPRGWAPHSNAPGSSGGAHENRWAQHQVRSWNSRWRRIQTTSGLMPHNRVSPHETATEPQTSVSK